MHRRGQTRRRARGRDRASTTRSGDSQRPVGSTISSWIWGTGLGGPGVVWGETRVSTWAARSRPGGRGADGAGGRDGGRHRLGRGRFCATCWAPEARQSHGGPRRAAAGTAGTASTADHGRRACLVGSAPINGPQIWQAAAGAAGQARRRPRARGRPSGHHPATKPAGRRAADTAAGRVAAARGAAGRDRGGRGDGRGAPRTGARPKVWPTPVRRAAGGEEPAQAGQGSQTAKQRNSETAKFPAVAPRAPLPMRPPRRWPRRGGWADGRPPPPRSAGSPALRWFARASDAQAAAQAGRRPRAARRGQARRGSADPRQPARRSGLQRAARGLSIAIRRWPPPPQRNATQRSAAQRTAPHRTPGRGGHRRPL